MLKRYFSEVEELSKELGKQLWVIVQRMLISVRREPTLIVTALRIIEREERCVFSFGLFAVILTCMKMVEVFVCVIVGVWLHCQ